VGVEVPEVRGVSAVAGVRLPAGVTGVVPELVAGGAVLPEGSGPGAGGGIGLVAAVGVGWLEVWCASAVACVRFPAGAPGVVPEMVTTISAYVQRFGDGTGGGVAELCPCNVDGALSVGSLEGNGVPAFGPAGETTIVSPVCCLEEGSGAAGGRMPARSDSAG
jgi:hypothetical protein